MEEKSKIQHQKPTFIIVGAGPAGTSLAIRLVKKGFKVTLIEREKFPRHKLCGEFISPECLGYFRELEVLEDMMVLGGDVISETIFYSENGKNVSIPSDWFGGSEKGALGLSRAEMDFRLIEKAKDLGVEVLEETSVVAVLFGDEKICGVNIRNSLGETKEFRADFTIDATGRAKVLVKLVEKEILRKSGELHKEIKAKILKKHNSKSKTQNSLVGFKAHLRNVNLEKGRCEIYFFRGGYGGLSYVEDGRANHCFLIKAEVVKEFKGDVSAILENVIFQNKRAKDCLYDAENLFEWLAVSVDGFGVKDLSPADGLIAIGDAAAFIDPFTGSGMLMALESAGILADVMTENEYSFETVLEKYTKLHQAKFKKRLRICSIMRRLVFAPSFAHLAIAALNLSEKASEILARSTRQTKIKNV